MAEQKGAINPYVCANLEKAQQNFNPDQNKKFEQQYNPGKEKQNCSMPLHYKPSFSCGVYGLYNTHYKPSIILLYATSKLTIFEISILSKHKSNVTNFEVHVDHDGTQCYETETTQREMSKLAGLIKLRNLTVGIHTIRACAVGQSQYSNLEQFEVTSSNKNEEKSDISIQTRDIQWFEKYLISVARNGCIMKFISGETYTFYSISSIDELKVVMKREFGAWAYQLCGSSLAEPFHNSSILDKFYRCITEVAGSKIDAHSFAFFLAVTGPTIEESMIWGNIQRVCQMIRQKIENNQSWAEQQRIEWEKEQKRIEWEKEQKRIEWEKEQKRIEWENKIKNSFVDQDLQQQMDEMQNILSDTDKTLNETVKKLMEAQSYFQPLQAQNDEKKNDL